jgi:hypothetical protein
MDARRSTLPSIMRPVQLRPAPAAASMLDVVQAVKVVEAAAPLLGVEGAAAPLLVAVTQAV